MDVRIVILLLGFGAAVLGQENDHPYLTQLKLSLREEKIPSVINYLLNNSLETHGITTRDIISLSKLDRFDQNEIVKVLGFFNITEVYTVDNLEVLLTTFNITFKSFYDDLKTKMGLSSDQVNQVIDTLQIPMEFWRDVTLHQDKELYNDLRKGIYDQEHINKALTATGRDLTQVYSSARDLLCDKVSTKTSSEFMSILTSNGWTSRTAKAWSQATNLTTRDVHQVEKFRQIFANISDDLNRNTTLGTLVGPNRIALHRLAFEDLQKIVNGVNVKVEAGELEIILRKTASLGANIVEVATNQSRSGYIEITESYNATDCIYVTLQDGQLRVTEVTIDGMTVNKDRVGFVLGSPLICEGVLYGLAGKENDALILFDRFYTEEHPLEGDEIAGDNESGNGGLDLLPCALIVTFNFLVTLVLL